MDVEIEREQRVQLRDPENQRAAQVSSSDKAKLLHVDRGRFSHHARWIAAEPRQRRVSGESRLLSVLSRCCDVESRTPFSFLTEIRMRISEVAQENCLNIRLTLYLSLTKITIQHSRYAIHKYNEEIVLSRAIGRGSSYLSQAHVIHSPNQLPAP